MQANIQYSKYRRESYGRKIMQQRVELQQGEL